MIRLVMGAILLTWACSAPPEAPTAAPDAPEGATEAPQAPPEAQEKVPDAPKAAPEAPPAAPNAARETPPGVKPHSVPCDPARPELPCTPDVPPLGLEPPAEKPLVGREVTELGTGRDEKAIRGCATDADCVVSCRIDGTCCLDQCLCETTYNKAFLAELEQHQARCIMKGCPKAKCADPGFDLAPVCTAGICATRKVPYAPE